MILNMLGFIGGNTTCPPDAGLLPFSRGATCGPPTAIGRTGPHTKEKVFETSVFGKTGLSQASAEAPAAKNVAGAGTDVGMA